jgi:hypothetical protein
VSRVVGRWRRDHRPRSGRVEGASRATTRPLAFGGYVPASRDMRGMRRSFKLTSVASSPMNKGSPAFGAERSVKPSAQATLAGTQHPIPQFSQLLLGKLLRSLHEPSRNGNGPHYRRFGLRTAQHVGSLSETFGPTSHKCGLIGPGRSSRLMQDPEPAGYTRDGSRSVGWDRSKIISTGVCVVPRRERVGRGCGR